MKKPIGWAACGCLMMALGAAGVRAQTGAAPLGIFSDHADVGVVLHAGSARYDEARRTYTIAGSGENVWGTADAFQFVWKKIEGDFALTAGISILGAGGNPHKKAILMARQSLDADSAYADVAVHASGLTSLQSRAAKGEQTHEVQANVSAPKRVRLVKHGDEFSLWIAGEDGKFQPSGAAMRVPLKGPFFVGLGVCAHDKDAVETAVFSDVESKHLPTVSVSGVSEGALETIAVASTDRRVTYASSLPDVGSPTWTHDGASLLFWHDGSIESVPVAGGKPETVSAGSASRIGWFYSVSPDGATLAFTHSADRSIYLMPSGGGQPRRVTAKSPSDSPGWSPDGETLVFTGTREGRLGIYTIPAAGGPEALLTTVPSGGFAEYSPDGKYIYFNSASSGAMEIWRMKPDGSEAEQVTKNGAGSWFPHVSPDGRLLAFLTPQRPDSGSPADTVLPVALQLMTLADGQVRTLAKFTGGVTSMPNPPWSPDSKRIAFASFQGLK